MVNLSIIILTYNTKDLTTRCLESLAFQYKKELERGEFEIIVVDNASSDASASEISNLKSQISNLRVVLNKENVGFAKGCNIGARVAKGKYILFLNSDTEVKDSGFLKMVEFLEKNKGVGILGGKLLNTDGSFQPSAGKFYTLFNLFFVLLGIENFLGIRKSPDKISKVEWVSGGCMIVKRTLFKSLLGFDENYFMYIEDMDLCFRANKLGFMTYFYPNVKVLHKELGSGNRTFAIINIYKGILYFYSKHKSYLEYIIAKVMLIVKAVFIIFIGIVTLSPSLRERYQKTFKFLL